MYREVSSNAHFGYILGLIIYVHAADEIGDKIQHIKIATILPNNNDYDFSIGHVQPSIEYAIEQVYNRNLLPEWIKLDVNYSDSRCNARDAPVAAFDYYMKKSVNLYLGPVCDYSLAPVARYAPYWKLPVISPGGFAHNFGETKSDVSKNTEGFFTLTRIGMTFNSMALSIIQTIKHFGWNKVQLTYDSDGHSEVSPKFCYLAGSALIQYIKELAADEELGHKFAFHTDQTETEKVLRDEVGVDHAGKCYLLNMSIKKASFI
jgi:hypothetical protein